VQAAIQCELGYRQKLRAYNNYKKYGDARLIHKNRGRPSNRKHPHQESILARYLERYEGFGPTLASEHLEKDGFIIDHETLRRLLLSKGLWKKQRKHPPYRQRREPKSNLVP
jgi:transposase